MDLGKLIRSNWVPVGLLTLLVAGILAIYSLWPGGEGNAAKVQAIAGVLGFAAAIVVALMTWAYVRTTQRMLEVQQATHDQQRPRVEPRVVRAKCVIDGPSSDYARVNFSLIVRIEFRNLSVSTPTTLRLVTAQIDGALQSQIERAYFDEMHATNAPDTYLLGPGQTVALNATVKMSFPNKNDALPEPPIRGSVGVSDTFRNEWDPLHFEAGLE